MIPVKEKIDCPTYYTLIQNNILNVLVYFEAFDHPLKLIEIQNNCSEKYALDKLNKALDTLLESKVIFEHKGYYSLQSPVTELVEKRLKSEHIADQYFEKSDFYIKIIKTMPFVRSVAISGSMSKGVTHSNGDIDYFIITEKNRLWLARTMLILFKKIFLLNSRKYFCINYFIAIDNMVVPDKNIFTATEIAYLIPVYNAELIKSFKESNNWIKAHYPHFNHPIERREHKGTPISKKIMEFLLGGSIGDTLDKLFMKITIKRWDKKFSNFNREKFELTMRSQRGVSKHHPRDFQNRVLDKICKTKSRLYPSITTKL